MTDFSQTSAFHQPDLSSLSDEMKEAVLNPVHQPLAAAQHETVQVRLDTLRTWWEDIEDVLWELYEGEEGRTTRTLESVRNEIREEVEKHAASAD